MTARCVDCGEDLGPMCFDCSCNPCSRARKRRRAEDGRAAYIAAGRPVCAVTVTREHAGPCNGRPLFGDAYCQAHAADDTLWAAAYGRYLGAMAVPDDLADALTVAVPRRDVVDRYRAAAVLDAAHLALVEARRALYEPGPDA